MKRFILFFAAILISASLNAQKIVIEHLTLETFKSKVFDYPNNKTWKYNGELPAIVDFYADWCKPCRMISPILEDIAKNYQGKLIVYKVNTDREKKMSQDLQINQLPSVLFIPKEGNPQLSIGLKSKEELEAYVTNILKVAKN